MLYSELAGEKYSKAEHRRALIPVLNNRSEGSIEFKHQNISAVLIHLGQPYIKGYLPRYNYQKVLEDVVLDFLIKDSSIEERFNLFAQKRIDPSRMSVEFDRFIVSPPKETPFYFSHNELSFSKVHSRNYHLYRLFNLEDQARMFIKTGDLHTICHSHPVSYKGYV